MDIGNLNGVGGDDDSVARGPHSQGCCQDNAAADFSLLTMPAIHAIDFTKLNLWLTITLVSMDPFYRPVIAVLEYKTRLLSQAVGEAMAFDFYVFCASLHSTIAFLCFISALKEQPLFEHLQNNTVLFFAYGLLLIGLGLKIYSAYSYGWKKPLGERHFKPVDVRAKEVKDFHHIDWHPYYHPNGASSVLCLMAVSLLRARLAGVVISILFALAYGTAYHTERFLLQADWSYLLREAQFTKIRAIKDKFVGGSLVSKDQ